MTIITQKEIAKRLKLSQVTVSRVLNNSPLVNDKTRQKILKELDEMGYSPNRNAKNLATGQKGVIGIVVPRLKSMSSIYFLDTFAGVTSELNKHHKQPLIYTLDSGSEFEQFLGEVDALIFFNINCLQGERNFIFDTLARTNVPFISIQSYPTPGIPFITIDNFSGGFEAANHLISLGHRRMMCVTKSLEGFEFEQRQKGFFQSCSEHELPLSEEDYIHIEDGKLTPLVDKICNTPPEQRPTGVFILDDKNARLFVFECEKRNIRVPEDISVIGFNDFEPYSMMKTPLLTTVRQPFKELGEEAARLICEKGGNEKNKKFSIMCNPELIIRESTTKGRRYE